MPEFNCWFRYNYFINARNIEEAEKIAEKKFITENLSPQKFIEKSGFDYKVIQKLRTEDIPF